MHLFKNRGDRGKEGRRGEERREQDRYEWIFFNKNEKSHLPVAPLTLKKLKDILDIEFKQ